MITEIKTFKCQTCKSEQSSKVFWENKGVYVSYCRFCGKEIKEFFKRKRWRKMKKKANLKEIKPVLTAGILRRRKAGRNNLMLYNLRRQKKELCDNCGVEPVKNKGDWCDDCNLPERSVIK